MPQNRCLSLHALWSTQSRLHKRACPSKLSPTCPAVRDYGRWRPPAPSVLPGALKKAPNEAAPSVLLFGNVVALIVKATDLIIIPIMIFMSGVAFLIHVFVTIFKLVLIPIPALPALLATAQIKMSAWSINTGLARGTRREASFTAFRVNWR